METFPAVILISASALVAFVIPVVFVALGLIFYSIAEWIATAGRKKGSLTT